MMDLYLIYLYLTLPLLSYLRVHFDQKILPQHTASDAAGISDT